MKALPLVARSMFMGLLVSFMLLRLDAPLLALSDRSLSTPLRLGLRPYTHLHGKDQSVATPATSTSKVPPATSVSDPYLLQCNVQNAQGR